MRIILPFTLILTLFAFTSPSSIFSDKIIAPPGTVQLSENLFMDECEISNKAWKEFTYYLLYVKNDSALYRQMLPDTTVWKTQLFNNSVFIDYYFRHPDYNGYPVVGVSYEQVKAFCEWRTERVNELLERTAKAPFKKVLYRLPTEKEWELAAAGKLELDKYPFGYEKTEYRSRGTTYNTFNCLYQHIDPDGNQVTNVIPVFSSESNRYGIFNMIGNVSEMVAEKGIGKGGNFNLYVDDCKVKNQQQYTSPQCWLGFRCICEIVENVPQPEKKVKKKEKKDSKGQ
jgi:formylglycine-generating enzyme required for sulfatase activity